MEVLKGLQPKAVMEYFERICSVPHGSYNTKQVSDLCKTFAEELGLKYKQDELNNLIVYKPASKGYENAETVILQGHIDMVCVKTESCSKDMAKEGIDLETDGVSIWAKDTSLGADDGIAVAMAFAILKDDTLPHPPIEVVLTVDEETGMDGARGLDCSVLKGRKMINLDSEEEGVFTVSCAGGVRADCVVKGTLKKAEMAETGYVLTLNGLLGGHSGAEIDKGRASANQQMGRVLYNIHERFPKMRLADIRGGKFDNVICPLNDARILIPEKEEKEFEAFVEEFDATLKSEYRKADPGIALSCRKEKMTSAFDEESTERMLHVLISMPQGVVEMSKDFEGIVQTSLNMGVIRVEEDALRFGFSIRSSIASQKEMLVQRVKAGVEYHGGTVTLTGNYPGWQYDPDSVLRKTAEVAYKNLNGKEAFIQATHGGLECGLLIDKIPGLDTISIGPNMNDIHSVNENIIVESIQHTYDLVKEILRICK